MNRTFRPCFMKKKDIEAILAAAGVELLPDDHRFHSEGFTIQPLPQKWVRQMGEEQAKTDGLADKAETDDDGNPAKKPEPGQAAPEAPPHKPSGE